MTALTSDRRARLRRRVRLIVAATIAYNVVEAIVAISAGTVAGSAALIGFGLDSVIETLSAIAVAWQFTREDPERWEKSAVRVIAVAYFLLAGYLVVDAVVSLATGERPDESPWGIGIALLSLIVMPSLAWFEMRTGRELDSKSVQADAKQLLLCTYLSAAALVGLLANSLFALWWVDAVAALVIAALAVREGLEAWQGGELESSVAVLSDHDD